MQLFNYLARQLKSGFTLIEVLVAAAIFASVVAIAVGIFSLSSTMQTTTEIRRNLAQDERYALETITRDIRLADEFMFCSDSSCTTSATEPKSDYIKVTAWGTSKIYGPNPSTNVISVGSGSPIQWQPLTSSYFTVSNFNSDKLFTGYHMSSAATQQPYVTIKFKIKNALANKESEKVEQTIQTSITTRAYKNVGVWK